MFDYKDASYFSDFFKNHPDFELIEEFKASENRDEKNLYVGMIEMLNTFHPLILRVEIPFTFPHNKLTFRTKSLSGYPHLIHNGKIKYGDWFCLNTPFAETVEEQLNQEILRLKEWINRQLRPGLPPIIKDQNVKQALAIANAYEWENPDEVNEFSSKALVTFVGDNISTRSSFKDSQGHFPCIITPDNRIYAFSHKIDSAKEKLPYIIVNDFPGDISIFEDFIRLKDFYNWSEDVCKHLLPQTGYESGKRIYAWSSKKYDIEYTESQALILLNDVYKELEKKDSYLYEQDRLRIILKKERRRIKVLPTHKQLIKIELDKAKTEVIANKGIKLEKDPWNKPIGEWTEEDYDREEESYAWFEYEQYRYHYFVIGFKTEEKLFWLVFNTNLYAIKRDQIHYDIKIKNVCVNTVTSLALEYNKIQMITPKMFFGRGALNDEFTNNRIALVGLGAIGSMVAESLAHGGIKKIGLWDSDIVEPGNICRSGFSLADLGKSKVEALSNKILSINPFIDSSEIKKHGHWFEPNGPNLGKYVNGSFYDNVNYRNQEEAIKAIIEYDIILDCTGSNEMLHFLSYAVPNKKIISLCITNHAKELILLTNSDGNPFELRKAFLSRIEQDTKNFYAEGDGCYSPTFLAKYSDISALVNLCIQQINNSFKDGTILHSMILSYCDSGILIDQIHTYKLTGYDIILNVSSETLLDALEFDLPECGNLGYILGTYSHNGKQILVTHFVGASNALQELEDAFQTSKGIIDYIGDYTYSDYENDSCSMQMLGSLASKAMDEEINTNNPLLALKTKNGTINFYLYINNQLVPFIETD